MKFRVFDNEVLNKALVVFWTLFVVFASLVLVSTGLSWLSTASTIQNLLGGLFVVLAGFVGVGGLYISFKNLFEEAE